MSFEFDGEKYKQASKHQKEWGAQLISALELNGDEFILDLGCGDGILTGQLSELTPAGKVTGIDASVGMIGTAKKLEKNNLNFICMDINDMNFKDSFDLVFSNAALHWVKNHKLLLANSITALKPNGVIKWSFGGYGNSSNLIATFKAVMNDEAYKGYFSNFEWPWFMPKKSEYEKLVSDAGFREINVELENADRYFSDCDEMIKWIDQPCIVPFMEHLPDSEKNNFRNAVVEMMIAKTMQSDGRCFETFRRIHVKARKILVQP